jgi:hypothetical protein
MSLHATTELKKKLATTSSLKDFNWWRTRIHAEATATLDGAKYMKGDLRVELTEAKDELKGLQANKGAKKQEVKDAKKEVRDIADRILTQSMKLRTTIIRGLDSTMARFTTTENNVAIDDGMELLKRITKHFRGNTDYDEHQTCTLLLNLQQQDRETAEEYIHRYHELRDALTRHGTTIQTLRKLAFVNGLASRFDNFKQYLKVGGITDEAAIEEKLRKVAEDVDAPAQTTGEAYTVQTDFKSSETLKCQLCHKIGHTADRCSKNKQRGRTECRRCKKFHAHPWECERPSEKVTCHECKKKGHYAFRCPRKQDSGMKSKSVAEKGMVSIPVEQAQALMQMLAEKTTTGAKEGKASPQTESADVMDFSMWKQAAVSTGVGLLNTKVEQTTATSASWDRSADGAACSSIYFAEYFMILLCCLGAGFWKAVMFVLLIVDNMLSTPVDGTIRVAKKIPECFPKIPGASHRWPDKVTNIVPEATGFVLQRRTQQDKWQKPLTQGVHHAVNS